MPQLADLPEEIIRSIASHAGANELKALRLTSKTFLQPASEHLFNSITLDLSIASVHRANQVLDLLDRLDTHSSLQYLKIVLGNLTPDEGQELHNAGPFGHMAPWVPVGTVYRSMVLDREPFRALASRLKHIQQVLIVQPSCATPNDWALAEYINFVASLESPISNLAIQFGDCNNCHFLEPFPHLPTTFEHLVALYNPFWSADLVEAEAAAMNRGVFRMFGKLHEFDIKFAEEPFPPVPVIPALRTWVSRMRNLRRLRVNIVDREIRNGRHRCQFHQSRPLHSFDQLLHDLTLPKLEHLEVYGLDYTPAVVGLFLASHQLEVLHLAQWRCVRTVPTWMDLDLMSSLAGDAFKALSLEHFWGMEQCQHPNTQIPRCWKICARDLFALYERFGRLSAEMVLHAISAPAEALARNINSPTCCQDVHEHNGVQCTNRECMYRLRTLYDHFPDHSLVRPLALELGAYIRRGEIRFQQLGISNMANFGQPRFALIVNGVPGVYSYINGHFIKRDPQRRSPGESLGYRDQDTFNLDRIVETWTDASGVSMPTWEFIDRMYFKFSGRRGRDEEAADDERPSKRRRII